MGGQEIAVAPGAAGAAPGAAQYAQGDTGSTNVPMSVTLQREEK